MPGPRAKQLELFPPDLTDRDALNAAQAHMRREQAAREATRPPGTRVHARRGRHRFSRFDPQRFAGPELDE